MGVDVREVVKKVLTEYFNPRDEVHRKGIELIVNNVEQGFKIIKNLVNEGYVVYPFKKPPYAVVLSGTASIPATLTAFVLADMYGSNVKYVVTSYEVVEGKGGFRDSHEFLKNLKKIFNFDVVAVDFTNPVVGVDAQKLITIIRESRGNIFILQGGGFIRDFIILNMGCTRIAIPYPRDGKLIFYDLTQMILTNV